MLESPLPFLTTSARILLLVHFLAAALQRNGAFVRRVGIACAGCLNIELQTAYLTYKQVSFFHVTTICHYSLLWMYLGLLGRLLPTAAFFMFPSFLTILTEPFNAYFHLLDVSGKRLPQVICVDGYAFRAQRVHLTATCTVEMNVRLVAVDRGKIIIKGPTAGVDALNDSVFHQQVENAVDSHEMNRAAPLEDIVDVADRQWVRVIPDNFQNPKPIGGCLEIHIRQQLFIVVLLAHKSS